MKKIIALIASLAMVATASIPVFAASVPADANVAANVTITDLNSQQSSTGREKYTLNLDLSGLGTLAAGGTRISLFELKVFGDNINKQGASVQAQNIGTISTYGDIDGGCTAIFTTGSVPTMYYGSSTLNSAVAFNFWGTPGQTLTYTLKIGYSQCYYDEDDEDYYLVKNDVRADTTVSGSVKVPGGEETPTDPTVSAELFGQGKWDNGYIWTATVSPNNNDITSFEATFTDNATGDTKTASIFNAAALEKYGTAADFSFKVGLKTGKTLSAASFGVNGLDQASVPVSK